MYSKGIVDGMVWHAAGMELTMGDFIKVDWVNIVKILENQAEFDLKLFFFNPKNFMIVQNFNMAG